MPSKRRGIVIQKQSKPKPKPKAEKPNLSKILSQGAMKNKQEMEELLRTHGGGFKTDFGLKETIDFGDDSKAEGWKRVMGYINGTVKDERIGGATNQSHHFHSPGDMNNKLEPLSPKTPESSENIADLTKIFMEKVNKQKKSKKTRKIKQVKLGKNFKQKKKATRNRPAFVTPSPNANKTLDIQYCDEPETNYKRPQMNNLKESISKLSTDFNNNNMFYQSMIKSANKRNRNQFFSRPNFKSIDAGAGDNEDALPSIHASTNPKRFPVKSRVMQSIRFSRNMKPKNFLSSQRNETPSHYSSDDDVSQTSKITRFRKSYINQKKVKQSMQGGLKGKFYVHKKEKSAKPPEMHQSVIRASTFLNKSPLMGNFGKTKKKEEEPRKSKRGFKLKRSSKTFMETTGGFQNNLNIGNLKNIEPP